VGARVAAVISGELSGWKLGVSDAGFGGMAIAVVIVVVMYFTIRFSIGEMSAALAHTGGAYSFASEAMGPSGGFITGLAETIEYVVTTGSGSRSSSPSSRSASSPSSSSWPSPPGRST